MTDVEHTPSESPEEARRPVRLVSSKKPSRRPSKSLQVRLDMTAKAAQRLSIALARGQREFVLSAVNGSVTILVQVSALGGGGPPSSVVDTRGVSINWADGTLSHGRSSIVLSRTELRLLGALAERGGKTISRAALASQIWSGAGADLERRKSALSVYVWSLRKHLRSVGLGDVLETVRGSGYRLKLTPLNGTNQFTEVP